MNEVPGPESTGSQPPSKAFLEAFQALFPGLLRDGVLDAHRLGELLDVEVAGVKGGKERFGLMWAGKQRAVEALQAPSYAALVPDFENSIDWESAENAFIEGDNLEVLKLLQKSYNDQVKLIYIDPPYNTGGDFVYNDDFSDPLQHYLEVTGQVNAEGNRLVANTETSGRKHSNWLTMMYPRLVLARNLLTQDGSIFVSIDDNEVHNLREIMDEIFGPENFIGQFVWAAGRKNNAKFVTTSHEYMLVYSRNYSQLSVSVGEWRIKKDGLDSIYKQFEKVNREYGADYAASSKAMKSWFRGLPDNDPAKRSQHYSHVDERGLYFPDNISAPGGGGPKYEVLHPVTKKPVKVPSRGYVFAELRLQELIADGRIHFGVDENSVPCSKRYLVDSEYEVPYSVFYSDGRGATKRLREFLGGDFFDFPKDELVLQKIIEFASNDGDIVMDFFAGSGTTGHAVALQNLKDGGNRRYVLVTIDEETDSKSFAREQGVQKVSEITLMRLKKVLETLGGTGLRLFRMGSSAFVPKALSLDNQLIRDSTLVGNRDLVEVASELLVQVGHRLDEEWQAVSDDEIKGIRSGRTLVVTERTADANLVNFAQTSGVSQLICFEDSFIGQDSQRANLYFNCKNANITFKSF